MKKVCMVVQNPMVKGGIAAVINGYHGSQLEKNYKIVYVESYEDGGKWTKLLKSIKGYFHFAKTMLVDKIDLVHIHSSFGSSFYRKLPYILMSSWAHKPIINHIHGADFDEFYVSAGKKKQQLIKWVYAKCNTLIALSEEWRERLSLIVPEEKVIIIENYSVLHLDALEERLKRNCNNVVLFLGELGYRKGCYDIPLVAERVAKVVKDVKFILCGVGSREDETSIKKLFQDKGIADHIEFPGWVRDVEKDRMLKKADVFFLPSYNEGMPMSVMDAIGYGLPVVSTSVGGIPKIVYDGENGYCCNPGDVVAMSNSIAELLVDSVKREKYSLKSMEIAAKWYSLEAHLKLLENAYNNNFYNSNQDK